MIKRLYDQAEEIGKSRTKLRKRLHEARSVLVKEFRERFSPCAYLDFEGKRLLSIDKTLVLQWENKGTTNQGSVYLREV